MSGRRVEKLKEEEISVIQGFAANTVAKDS